MDDCRFMPIGQLIRHHSIAATPTPQGKRHATGQSHEIAIGETNRAIYNGNCFWGREQSGE
jgi:hypothetical protein